MIGRISIALLLVFTSTAAEAKRRTNHNNAANNVDIQVRLARANASPGPIDGKAGKNQQFAIRAYERMKGLPQTGRVTAELRNALGNDPTMADYTITEQDVAGPFIEKVPAKLEEMAALEHMGYTNKIEALAEKFHMSEDLLRSMNPRANFEAGDVIKVVDLGETKLSEPVKRIEVDKAAQAVFAYAADDRLIAAYPSTIGSQETPSPEGRHKVTAVALNPTYVYDPEKLDFKGVEAKEKIEVRPGPNNPVGLVWIALDAPSYGIHGSPEPSGIRRQESHGCVRLTNWDALQLAAAVKKGVEVDFVGGAETEAGFKPAATVKKAKSRR